MKPFLNWLATKGVFLKACDIISVVERDDVVRFETVVKNAEVNGWDEPRAFAEFRSYLVEWLTREPLHLAADGAPLRVMCEMLLDPDEGPLIGGYGCEDLDSRDFNRVRAKLFGMYDLPLARFAGFFP